MFISICLSLYGNQKHTTIKTTKMATLNLKRKLKGNYEAESENIIIRITNPYAMLGIGTNMWEMTIEEKSTGIELFHDWFDTKKDASKFGAEWVFKNLVV